MIYHFAILNLSILLNGWNAIQIEGYSCWVLFLMDYYSIERTILLGGQMAKGAQHEQPALTMHINSKSKSKILSEMISIKSYLTDIEQLSQKFTNQIYKTKFEKKFAKKPKSIWYEAWSYCFHVLIIFLVNFGFNYFFLSLEFLI